MTAPPPTIAVTGASGFVCANITNILAARGARVLACDIDPPPPPLKRRWDTYGDRVSYVQLDVAHGKGWSALDGEPLTAIIHGAAVTPGHRDPDPPRTARTNLVGTVHGLEYARQRGGLRFVYIGSSGVYGSTVAERPLRETRVIHPPDSYCIAKFAGEQYVSLYRDMYALDACTGRIAAPYGPWDRPTWASGSQSPIFGLIRAALRGQVCRIVDPEAARDWTYVEDTAGALIHLATLPRVRYDLYNISCGRPISLRRVAEIIGEQVRATFVMDATSSADVSVEASQRRSPVSIVRLRSSGFEAQVPIEVGVVKYLEWLRTEGTFAILADGGK
jgi:nucleoside-diphosphate-sugar epimerase